MKFSIQKFYSPTPVIVRKLSDMFLLFSHIVAASSLFESLNGENKFYINIALGSLFIGAFFKAMSNCFYEDKDDGNTE